MWYFGAINTIAHGILSKVQEDPLFARKMGGRTTSIIECMYGNLQLGVS